MLACAALAPTAVLPIDVAFCNEPYSIAVEPEPDVADLYASAPIATFKRFEPVAAAPALSPKKTLPVPNGEFPSNLIVPPSTDTLPFTVRAVIAEPEPNAAPSIVPPLISAEAAV